jgi:glycerate dehydrogenase
MLGVFLDTATFGKGYSFELLKTLPIQWRFYENTAPSETIERLQDVSIAVTNKVVIDRSVIHALPRLKMIAVVATGVNCIDIEAAREAGIAVCNVRDYSTATVTQMAVLMILSLASSFIPYVEDVKKGRWQHESLFCFLDYPIAEVKGKKLGILGYGNLGKEVARIMSAFGMKILVVESPRTPIPGSLPLMEVLKQCDCFTIHTPLTPETRHLIGKEQLALMKKTAFLINVSRGEIVDEEALARALKNKTIAGAALDVLSKEPPPPNHPLLDPSIPNLILTPHIAWGSNEARKTILEVTRDNIQAFLDGSPQNLVN